MRQRAPRIAWRAIYALSILILAGIIPFGTSGAHAVDGTAGAMSVSADPTTNLADGQTVNVHVKASGVAVYSLTTHICIPGKVNGDTYFGFVGPYCSNVPVGSGDIEKQVAVSGTSTADLAFKVGIGTANWTNDKGFQNSVTCDPSTPCEAVLRVEITNGTVYVRIPLCFSTTCPLGLLTFVGSPAATGAPTVVSPVVALPAAAVSGAAANTPQAGGGAAALPGEKSATAKVVPKKGSSSSSRTHATSARHNRKKGTPTPVAASSGLSRNIRVLLAGLVGALGGMRILWVLRRKAPRLETL